jgi:hypothetical protein
MRFDVNHNGAANSVCSLPPCAGGLGRGVDRVAISEPFASPPPLTPPHKGEGDRWGASLRNIGSEIVALYYRRCV